MNNVISEVVDAITESSPLCLAPDVPGLTAPKVRMLLHKLVEKLPDGEAYLEVGCDRGATLISALLDRPEATAYAVPIWSNGEAKDAFEANMEKYAEQLPKIKVFEEDFFKLIPRRPFSAPVGLYFYDGSHMLSSQRAAIGRARVFLAKQVIFVVDDWALSPVREGTWGGIHDLQPRTVVYRDIRPKDPKKAKEFYNGLGIFFLEL